MTDIVDRIKAIAVALGWKFTYGEADIKNLIEAAQAQTLVPNEIHLMLLPVIRQMETNDYGRITAIKYDLAFSIFTPDDFDILVNAEGNEYYFEKFSNKIKPMLTAYYFLHRNLICPGLVLTSPRLTEVYNDGTENLTGLFILASCTMDVDDMLGEIVPVPPLPPIPTLCELIASCEVFIQLEERVTALEAITPEDLISSDEGNQLTTGTDGGLYVAESGGGGLTCEDLEDCEVIQDLQQDVQAAQSTADGAAAAALAAQGTADSALSLANAAYPATNPDGFQTSSQVASLILPLLPLANYYGSAGHTGDTNETIVLTFAIQPSQWLSLAMYGLNIDTVRTAGSVTYRFYLNTSSNIGGLLIGVFVGTVSFNGFRHVMKSANNFSFAASTVTAVTDISSGVTAARTSGVIDATGTLHLVCTIEGGNNAANGEIINIHFGKL